MGGAIRLLLILVVAWVAVAVVATGSWHLIVSRAKRASSRASDQIRALVVEDERDARALLRATLERDGRIQIIGEAADGAEGLALAARLHPEAILLDLRLPTMSGEEILPRLRASLPDTVVVVVSALPGPEHEAEVKQLGAAAYVDKSNLREVPSVVAELCAAA